MVVWFWADIIEWSFHAVMVNMFRDARLIRMGAVNFNSRHFLTKISSRNWNWMFIVKLRKKAALLVQVEMLSASFSPDLSEDYSLVTRQH